MNLGYLILKTIPYLSAQDGRRLLELRDKGIVGRFMPEYLACNARFCGNAQKIAATFLACYVSANLNLESCEDEDDIWVLLHDYFRMALFLHQTPRISFHSERKVQDAHDKLAARYNESLYGLQMENGCIQRA